MLLEDLLEQEKREQQQQMPQGPQQIQGPPGGHPQGPGMDHMMVRAPMQQQSQLPPGAAPGPIGFVRNPMVQPPQRLQWQAVRHPQEVTLQQRGPMGVGPPMMGGPPRLPVGAGMISAPMPLSEPHSSVMSRQEPTPPPGSQPPTPLNAPPMTPPPENPQTEDDRQKVSRSL